ncbi:hypothetical protein LAZ67_16001794 [Cordylochernes scorpioides]|uniref:Uncharacterized protein n=1 Tax=Cordylochernes scorpioides TaxID=51811 RepID=A0ABY6LBF4_9ARAC|nr:hypothetical protein LAZ67_16001794 [Cordylochernes scorpioides]
MGQAFEQIFCSSTGIYVVNPMWNVLGSRGSGCVMGFPHWDSKETVAGLDGNSKKVEVDHGRSQSDHGRHGCPTSRIGLCRLPPRLYGRVDIESRQDSGRQGKSKQIDHCLYRKMEQGREENPKEPKESDPDSESGGSTTFPKKENTLGRTEEIAPGQEDVTPPPPVSDVLGRLTTTLHQLSAVTGHRERWNRYDGSYEAQSFFTNYDAQADRAQLQYSTRLRKPPNLLQAPLRVTNTRARQDKIPYYRKSTESHHYISRQDKIPHYRKSTKSHHYKCRQNHITTVSRQDKIPHYRKSTESHHYKSRQNHITTVSRQDKIPHYRKSTESHRYSKSTRLNTSLHSAIVVASERSPSGLQKHYAFRDLRNEPRSCDSPLKRWRSPEAYRVDSELQFRRLHGERSSYQRTDSGAASVAVLRISLVMSSGAGSTRSRTGTHPHFEGARKDGVYRNLQGQRSTDIQRLDFYVKTGEEAGPISLKKKKRKIVSLQQEETSMNIKKEATTQVQRALGSTREEPIEDMVKEEIRRTLAPISKSRKKTFPLNKHNNNRPAKRSQAHHPFSSLETEDKTS